MTIVTLDARDLVQKLDALTERQLPFAAASGLTSLAFRTNDRNRAALPSRFTIRSTWTAKGYRVKKATKYDLSAVAYHLDEMLALQEAGGMKTGRGGKKVAVPLAARPTPTSVTRPSSWPGKVITNPKKRAFEVPGRGGTKLVFQRTGRRSKGKRKAHALPRTPGQRDPNLRLLWVRRPSVKITPRLHFRDDAMAVVQEWPSIFEQALARAIATAR